METNLVNSVFVGWLIIVTVVRVRFVAITRSSLFATVLIARLLLVSLRSWVVVPNP